MEMSTKEKRYFPYSTSESVSYEEVKKIITDYNEAIANNKFTRYHEIVKMIPCSCGEVLDYGCGWGCISKAIAEKKNRVTGIDILESAIEIAKDFNMHEDLTFMKCSISELDDEKFDVVNSNEVLEHVHNPGTYLMNINRVLKVGGDLVLSTPNVINLHFVGKQIYHRNHSKHFSKLSSSILNNYTKDAHHIQGWDPDALVRLLGSLGFEYQEHKFIEGVMMPLGRYKHSYFPWRKYFHTKIPHINNLTRTMLFRFKKIKHVSIGPED